MNARSKSIAKEAQGLPAADRIRLVEFLLASLDKPDPDIDRIWAEESERRLDAYLKGEVTARDAQEVLAKHMKP
jgi:putative addiction module component (TIGR02574 family)